jgi:hypothetical protein
MQVEIIDSSTPSYPLTEITMSGITFSDFSQVSVYASASAPTNLNLMDVVFTVSPSLRHREKIERERSVSHSSALP